MSFEQFKPSKKHINTKNTYTIQAGTKKTGYFSGMVYFNGGMRDALNLQEYTDVELYTDRDKKLIAVKFGKEKTDNTRTKKKNGNHRFITCSSWLKIAIDDLGYPEKGSGEYEQLENGLVILHKPELLNPSNTEAKD